MATFVYDPSCEQAMLRSAEVAAALQAVLDEAVADAKQLAGARPHLVKSIEGSVQTDEQGLVGVVEANWFVAWFIEAGTVNQAATPFLRPGVEMAVRRHGGDLTAIGRVRRA